MPAPTTTSAPSIVASVGSHAANGRNDVIAVQKLLNIAAAGLREDGNCGPATIGAIKDYQRNFLAAPDGRVDPGGLTWRNLVEGKLKVKRDVFTVLPQQSGSGYYPYSSMDRQYGALKAITALVEVCVAFKAKYPTFEIGIGDISFSNGAHMPPHNTHRDGRSVDIRPLRTDAKQLPVTFTSAEYSREHTKAFVELLRASGKVDSILFNDTSITGVKFYAGHHNHLHVTFSK